MRAEVVAVGSELLTPARLDTNSLLIARELNSIGVRLGRKTIVGDRPEDLQEALTHALGASEIVMVTGGLGPTTDDITREVAAGLFGKQLSLNEQVLERIRARYERSGQTMPPNNRRQAMVPEGSLVLPNANGTAPGLLMEEQGRLLFLLPGPPNELEPMLIDQVIPLIVTRKGATRLLSRHLKVAGEAESKVDFMAAPIYSAYPAVETTILASLGVIDLFFYWRPTDGQGEAEGHAILEEVSSRVRQALGPSVYTEQEETVEEVVGRRLKERGLTLALAESCTGGLISKVVTDVPGSSDYFLGGVVTYSNAAKIEWLEVDRATIEQHGAVSEEVAGQMAAGVRRKFCSDIGLAVTGIAGPGGGTPEKPVGLVYVGVCDSAGIETRKLVLNGDRNAVRVRTSRIAIDWLRRRLG